MSHEIEHGKRVLRFRDQRVCSYEDTCIYLISYDSNNVHPRSYDWHLVAMDTFSEWNGEQQVPRKIWDLGSAADGGSIQPWGKPVSGLNYVRAWKRAAKNAAPLFGADDKPLWRPEVSLGTGWGEDAKSHADKINASGAEIFGKRPQEATENYARFKALFPEPLTVGHNTATIRTRDDVINALLLWRSRDELPFGYYVGADEGNLYLRDCGKQEPALA